MTDTHGDMSSHEFDGIKEFDNPPPRWVMAILYVTLIFAVGYWLYYQTFAVGWYPTTSYQDEMARAAEAQLAKMSGQAITDQSLLLMAAIPARVDEGRQIFAQFCVACHAAGGEGNVGPNLTDNYWIHGGKPTQILNTVTKGVLDKGMVAWGPQLGPARVQKVVAYVLTIKGTNRPGKAPQGQLESAETAPPVAPVAAPPAGSGVGRPANTGV